MTTAAERAAYQRKYRRKMAGLELVPERAILSEEQLRFFAEPRTWPEILAFEPRAPEEWWRTAIIEADQFGLGLLLWAAHLKAWGLSARGREVAGLKSERNRR